MADTDFQVPIVFLTAHASEDEERRARWAGGIDFLRKSVGKETCLRLYAQCSRCSPGGKEATMTSDCIGTVDGSEQHRSFYSAPFD